MKPNPIKTKWKSSKLKPRDLNQYYLCWNKEEKCQCIRKPNQEGRFDKTITYWRPQPSNPNVFGLYDN